MTIDKAELQRAKEMADAFTKNQVAPLSKVSEQWVLIETIVESIKSLRLDNMDLDPVHYNVLDNIQKQCRFISQDVNMNVRRSQDNLQRAFNEQEGIK
jgi:hypothetical protein|tara:strand:+ start:6424 stop:6717 length:294 start_codon:yes stop_codon:yes gene_type:complete